MMSTSLDLLISKLKSCNSPQERMGYITRAAEDHLFTCDQLGVVLMTAKFPAERKQIAQTLSTSIIDPENARTHLSTFLICDAYSIRSHIINSISTAPLKTVES